MPANILRGGFGITLKRIASSEIYSRIFEPKLPGGPSGDIHRKLPVRPGNLLTCEEAW